LGCGGKPALAAIRDPEVIILKYLPGKSSIRRNSTGDHCMRDVLPPRYL
jgi:hypothetical protein